MQPCPASTETALVLAADDPLVAALGEGRDDVTRFGIDDPRVARPSLQHAADSKYCLRCGRPYVYDAAYVGHLGATAAVPVVAPHDRRSMSQRRDQLSGLAGCSFELATTAGTTRVSLPLPGSPTSTTRWRRHHSRAGRGLDDVRRGLEGFSAAFGRLERMEVGERSVLMLLIKNPARANEAVRTLLEEAPPRSAVVALNDGIADGTGCVVDLGRRLRACCTGRQNRRLGARAAELAQGSCTAASLATS